MIQKQRFNLTPLGCLMLAVSLLFLMTSDLFGAQSSTVSLVTDSHIGPATRHGVNKVRMALRAKGIRVEQTTSLETTNGNFLLVMGLSGGSGPAVKLHNSLDIPKPKGAESLLVRHTTWSGKKCCSSAAPMTGA